MTTTNRRGWTLAILGVAVLMAGAAALWWHHTQPSGTPVGVHGEPAAVTVSGLPPVGPPVRLAPPEVIGAPAVILQIPDPARLMELTGANAWLQAVVKTPLGRGFLGGWAALLNTSGEDLRASFSGSVARFLAQRLLDRPTHVVWFGGASAPSAPALVTPAPSETARAAFATLTQASQRGVFVSTCPSPPAQPGKLANKVALHPTLNIIRWLIAERPLYALLHDKRLVIAASPETVVHAACAELPELDTAEGVALDLTFLPRHMGREAQLLGTLLGLGESTHAAFAFGPQGTLVPQGIAGPLSVPSHLDKAPLAKELLKTIPEDAPVVLGLQLRLPLQIDAANLKAYFAGNASTPTLETRQVALVWYPRAGLTAPIDVALVWSRPADRAALQEAFSGNNALFWREGCGQLILASNAAVGERLARACDGKDPSILQGAGPVVTGLARPTSVSLGVNVGRLLANLLREGYGQDPLPAPPGAPPPEIEAAARQLLELPFVGLQGGLDGSALAPEGFRT